MSEIPSGWGTVRHYIFLKKVPADMFIKKCVFVINISNYLRMHDNNRHRMHDNHELFNGFTLLGRNWANYNLLLVICVMHNETDNNLSLPG